MKIILFILIIKNILIWKLLLVILIIQKYINLETIFHETYFIKNILIWKLSFMKLILIIKHISIWKLYLFGNYIYLETIFIYFNY